MQNFNLRNGRLKKRTKTDAVQEKICTKTIKYWRSSNQNDHEAEKAANVGKAHVGIKLSVTTMRTGATF